MKKLRVGLSALLLCIPVGLIFPQNADIRKLSEKDVYREKQLNEKESSIRNQTWEDVSLSLLVPDIERSASDAGLESFGVSIADNTINIIYRDIRFQPNSSEVTPETVTKLKKLSKILERFSDMGLLIEGHTTRLSKNDSDDGMKLSENRAKSVAAIITATGIFSEEKIQAVGKGFYEPVIDDYSPKGQALNRRVEISIGGALDTGGKNSETRWWDFLSSSMKPGYTAYLVHNKTVQDVKTALDAAGISGLVIAQAGVGVGILDDSLVFKMNGSPNSKSVSHIQSTGKTLTALDVDTEVRIGGYTTDLPGKEISERLFLTAYTMATTGGVLPAQILFGKENYVLTKATTALKTENMISGKGTAVQIKADGTSYMSSVPYETDSVKLVIAAEDPLAVINGVPADGTKLNVGRNDITVTVETSARPQKFSETYTFSVIRQPIPGTTLKSLSVRADSGATLELKPGFSPDVTDYEITVQYPVKTVTVKAEKADERAILDSPAAAVNLSLGDNEIVSTVTTKSRKMLTSYKVMVKRNPPAIAMFTVTAMNKGKEIETTDLDFEPETTAYNLTVPFKATSVKLDALLRPEDEAAGAKIEALNLPEGGRLEVGDNNLSVRVTDAEDNTYDYTVTVTREKLVNFSLDHEWFVTPSVAIYTNGMGGSADGGINFMFADNSKVPVVLNHLSLGVGGKVSLAAGNYITVLTCGGYVRSGYKISTDDLFEYHWFLPTAFIPRVDMGFSYIHLGYADSDNMVDEAALYFAPGIRMDFVLPKTQNIKFGLDFSYALYLGSIPVDCLNAGITVAW